MKHIKVIIVAVCAFWRFGFLKAPTFEKKCPVKLKAANLYRNVFFIYYQIYMWNSLSQDIIEGKSLAGFKKA